MILLGFLIIYVGGLVKYFGKEEIKKIDHEFTQTTKNM